MAGKIKVLRCAIYTRKSSEEGLEQDFNSLDAQRESCEAYIKSQRHEGWIVLPETYDDGGFSGGTLERPAMQRLLADIAAGKIDIVLVYKVDRLTRALSDFARIVEVFDGQGVSFVSVTQQFNTTTSMGRLTLNVLLSFAQFEREVTGERIRDKFLASRQRGIWMGGHPPLGYDLKDRKLVVNDRETELVCRIFTGYSETGCIKTLKAKLDSEGAVSKRRTSNAGIAYGGKPFTRGALYKILGNRVYLGEAVHKNKAYPGEHKSIIERALWDSTQQQLNTSRVTRLNGTRAKDPSLLSGLIFDGQGRRLTPSHATKGMRRYRYYVTPSEGRVGDSPELRAWRIPAGDIEELVKREVLNIMENTARLDEVLDLDSVPSEERLRIYQAALARAAALKEAQPTAFRPFLTSFVERITVGRDAIHLDIHRDRLEAAICREFLADAATENDAQDKTDQPTYSLRIETRLKRCGGETRLVLLGDGQSEMLSQPDPGLIKAVAKAHAWARQLTDGEASSIAEIASREGTSRPHASRLLNLAFLAPDIIEAVLDGRQPPEVNVELLTKVIRIPLSWNDQRRLLGFS